MHRVKIFTGNFSVKYILACMWR